MSPELFNHYFIKENNSVMINEKKSNTFSIGLLISQFICNLGDD